jgi:primosomal protein N' (replication factor Y)
VPRIARIVPEVSLDRAFDYAIPAALDAQVILGAKVRVPFKSRMLVGYVVDFPTAPHTGQLREIEEVLSQRAFLPASLIELAQWMAQYYCAPLTVALLSVLPKAVRHADAAFKQRLWVERRLPALPEETLAALKRAKAQLAAWHFLAESGPGWLADLSRDSGIGTAAWNGLAERQLIVIEPRTQDRDPYLHAPVAESAAWPLNPDQAAALEIVRTEVTAEKPRVVLLHGVTGSGKTEVYLQAIAQVLALGKSALVLVPEIALTPQTVEHFRARFVGQKVGVAVLHSHLSSGERHDQWQHIRAGRARIVIGARSAVFAPLDRLGLIVVDEEHEVMRGHLERVAVLLGSATPSLESYHHAKEGKYRLAPLPVRVEEGQMPVTHVLDIRAAKKNDAPTLLAPRLVEAIHARLARHEQAIIFLNRRGYASSLQCPQCGYVEMCPNCSVALTFHRRAARVRCHLCDFDAAVPPACPACGFAPFKHAGMGTEKVEDALVAAFPQARIERMDSDTMRGKDAYAKTLGAFGEGKIDILVGTQGPPLSPRHLRGRHQRRSRPANPRLPRQRTRLPVAHAGLRPQRARRGAGRGVRADARAVSSGHPVRAAPRLRRVHRAGIGVPRQAGLPAVRALHPRHRAWPQRGEDALCAGKSREGTRAPRSARHGNHRPRARAHRAPG